MLASSKIKKFAKLSFIFFPDIAKLNKFQKEEDAKVWFNLALVMFGSLAIKIFQSTRPDIYTLGSFIKSVAKLELANTSNVKKLKHITN